MPGLCTGLLSSVPSPHVLIVCVCSFSPRSLPATICDAAPTAAADPAAAGGGAAEGPLPLPQHQAGQQPGLGVPAPRSRLQQVGATQPDPHKTQSLVLFPASSLLYFLHHRHYSTLNC